MENLYFEQENSRFHPPGLRQRLQSAPEKMLKTPTAGKTFHASLYSGRKALGRVNQVQHGASSVNAQKLLKPQEKEPKVAESYPDVEKFFPYDPLEFEKYSFPEDLVPLSKLALPGLACVPPVCLRPEAPETLPLTALSPVKQPGYCSELGEFLLTLEELTVEFPAETDI